MKYLLLISGFILSFTAYSQYSSTTTDMNKNWTVGKIFKYDGSVKNISKQYYDNNGNPTQTQTRNMSAGQVIAAQMITDAYGRPVIHTMPATVNSTDFGYKNNFVLNPSGTTYNFLNFDDNKTNSPDAIGGQSTAGTLGWYYSNNNTVEARTATSSYPYSRFDYYKDGTGSAKKVASTGDIFRMGQGKEVSAFQNGIVNELNQYFQVRNKYFTAGEVGNLPTTLSGLGKHVVAKDAAGKEIVSITDREGKVLMSARPGSTLVVNNTIELSALNYQFVISTTAFTPFSHFTIKDNGADGVVILNGTQVYSGLLSSYTPPTTQFLNLTILANKRFIVSYQVNNILGNPPVLYPDIASSETISNEIFYFKLINDAGSTVTVTPDAAYGGTFDLYDMNTEQLVPGYTGSGTVAKGYYKLVVKRGKVNLAYSNSYDDVTYYFYNHEDQLISVVPPEGAKRLIQNLSAYPAKADVPFISTYEYDVRGRLTAINEPDKGRIEYIYRKDGRIRFSQNAQQQVSGWFSYTNYDAFGKAIEGGEYRPNGDVTFTGLKTNTAIIEDVSSTGGLPNAANKYDWIKVKRDVEDNSHGQAGYAQTFVRGGISMTEGPDSKTWYSYNDQGLIIWAIKWINGLGYKTTDYTFDTEGKLVKVVYQKNVAAETFVHYYEYDADERLEKVYTNTTDNSSTKILQQKFIYFVHGGLKRVEMGGNLQGVDYTYTLDGQLKAINHSDNTKDPGNDNTGTNGFLPDAFGEVLEYYNNDYVRSGTNITSMTINPSDAPEQFTGQLRGMSWFSKKPTGSGASQSPTMYVFKYDGKSQFLEATWGSISGTSFVPQAGVNKEIISAYDLHGNIQNLSRTNSGGSSIDNLLYNYVQTPKFTNRLGSVTQQTTGQNYATYQYDNIGQIKAEIPGPAFGSAISKYLEYSASGKVKGVYSNVGQTTPTVKNVYDEFGNRIKKLSYNASGVLLATTYFVYDGTGKLMSVYDQPNGGSISQKEIPVFGGGRLAVYYRSQNAYRYEMVDHLGNVRTVFIKTVSNNIDAVVYKDYYPFGMPIPSREYSDGTGYRYSYQGQYAQKDDETNWYAFEMRMYDSKLARWLSIDPQGEYWSPYLAMGNDPVNNTDPDGGCVTPECRARAYAAEVGGTVGYSEKKGWWTVSTVGDNSTITIKIFKGYFNNYDFSGTFTRAAHEMRMKYAENGVKGIAKMLEWTGKTVFKGAGSKANYAIAAIKDLYDLTKGDGNVPGLAFLPPLFLIAEGQKKDDIDFYKTNIERGKEAKHLLPNITMYDHKNYRKYIPSPIAYGFIHKDDLKGFVDQQLFNSSEFLKKMSGMPARNNAPNYYLVFFESYLADDYPSMHIDDIGIVPMKQTDYR